MPTKAELQARVEILEKENASLKGMLARERRVHLDRIFHLQKRVEELERRLNCYPVDMVSAIPPIPIEMQIRLWMEEYGMPWEIFFCFDHKQWVDELDNSFPYFTENTCPVCRKNGI